MSTTNTQQEICEALIQRYRTLGKFTTTYDSKTSDADIQLSMDTFFRGFESIIWQDGLLITTLVYKFRGDSEPIPARWIGVPGDNLIYYVSEAGRVACTGTGAVQQKI
jgi:hypothetical protein